MRLRPGKQGNLNTQKPMYFITVIEEKRKDMLLAQYMNKNHLTHSTPIYERIKKKNPHQTRNKNKPPQPDEEHLQKTNSLHCT